MSRNKKKSLKSTRAMQREEDSLMIVDAMTAAKQLLTNRKQINQLVELNVGGLKIQIVDKDALFTMLDSHISEARKYGLNEDSAYGEKDNGSF